MRDAQRRLAHAGVLCTILLLVVLAVAEKPPLKLRPDGTFKIMLFTDLHFGYGGKTDKKSIEQMRNLMGYEEPDLVVLGGDQISDYAPGPIPKPRAWWKQHYGNALTALSERNGRTPWVSILGNHDYGTEGDPDEILVHDSSFTGSLTIPSNNTGQVLSVLDKNGDEVAARLYMFHSGPAGCYPRHADWYRNTSLQLRRTDPSTGSSPTPALAFLHIPLVQMMDVYNSGSFRGVMRDRDGICCQVTSHTLFEDFVAYDEVKLISSGHDHDNSFAGSWEGIQMVYGRKTGAGGYNIKGKYGARVFLLRSTPTLPTDSTLGAVLYSQHRPGRSVLGPSSNTSFTINSWIRHIDGSVDEQLDVIEEIPVYQITSCCKGPPKETPWALILGTTGTGLLVVVAVSLLIHGYCRYKKYVRAMEQTTYVPMEDMN